jgi:hypothetical protein
MQRDGALYLTNVRLIFEVLGPAPYTAVEVPLDGIWNLHTGSTSAIFQGTTEYLTVEGSIGRVVISVQGARAWADAILRAKASIPPPPPPLPVPPPPPGYVAPGHVVVNVQAPEAPKIMMHCRNCGNLYDATKGRCDKCGAPPT